MLRVRFYDEDSTGTIVYYSKTKELRVSHPNLSVRNRIRKYLTSEKYITTSLFNVGDIGKQRQISTPIDSLSELEQALGEMNYHLGFWVDWSDAEGGTATEIEIGEKEVAKSLDGNVRYNILNR